MFLPDFHCKENDGTTVTAHLIKTLLAVSSDIKEPGKPQESGFLAKKKSELSVLLQSFRHFLYNENPTRALLPHSNAAFHQLTLLTGEKKFTYAYECSRYLHASALL